MVNHGHLNVVHGQTRTTRLSPWSNMDTYMQTMVRTSKTIMSMVFDGLVLHTSMDFDGCSWISMVDHQIPCSPWSFMVTISPGFDAVSWKFLYKVLESFGFDEKFIKWIKLFNNNINAHILQCGFLSSAIPIERGCRQGDPIAPYLFLLVAEIWSLLIEKNPDIKGIQVGKQMIKVTQFADDTTLLLDGSSSSLQATLNVLESFGSLSGLKVNSEKTKLVWIGSKKHSKEKLYSTAKLQWIDSEFSILGIDFSTELLDIPRINYNKGLAKANKIINSWNYRHLTPIGKITVIKTLILSNFTHLFMSIPTSNIVMRDIETMLYQFLWAGKPDRVSRKDICKTNVKGGMKMINVCNFEKKFEA